MSTTTNLSWFEHRREIAIYMPSILLKDREATPAYFEFSLTTSTRWRNGDERKMHKPKGVGVRGGFGLRRGN